MFERCFKQFEKLHRLYLHKNAKKEDVRFGITKAIARQLKYTGDMQNLSIDFAKKYYKARYWKPLNLEGISKFEVCYYLFETAIICGVGDDGVMVAAKHLQETMNHIRGHLNAEKNDFIWSELTGEYQIDASTISALKKLFNYPTKRMVLNGGSKFYPIGSYHMDRRLVEGLKCSLREWSKAGRREHFSWIRWVDQHGIKYKELVEDGN